MNVFLFTVFLASSPLPCKGPFSGWLSGPSMDHGELAPVPLGDGHVLCCHGTKGAWPSGDDPSAVLRLWPDASLGRSVAIVADHARCPNAPTPVVLQSAESGHPPNFVCEPFGENQGCSVTPGMNQAHGCKAQHGFPSVAGHGGCASSVVSEKGWVHTKCCAGELGHAGTHVIAAKPYEPHLQLHVFNTLTECIESTCPVKATTEILPCRCTFPSHVCSAKGPDHCVEFQMSAWSVNTDATCGLSGPFYLSIESCVQVCKLDDDCMGFEVDKASMRICRIFTGETCHNPQYGAFAGTHLYTKKITKGAKKNHHYPSSKQTALNVGIFIITTISVLILIVLISSYIF